MPSDEIQAQTSHTWTASADESDRVASPAFLRGGGKRTCQTGPVIWALASARRREQCSNPNLRDRTINGVTGGGIPLAHTTAAAAVSGIASLAGRLEKAEPEISHLSDESLMQRYQDGDNAAFEILYRRYRARLHRFVARMLGGAEADEVFQDVWLALIRGRGRYRPSARFVTFLFTIAHHRSTDSLRKKGKGLILDTVEEGMADVPDGHSGPFDDIHNAQLAKALGDAIARLPLPQREAFLLKAEGDLSLDEIAQASGAPRETIKSRLRYAQKSLRRSLETWQ
jgi:RNA polymerase sigma-70 factor (ECF subfamily)